MKNLKQVLALGMAFSLTMSTMAGAAFTDQDKISAANSDAVELLTALDVIQGNPDGSFNPEGTVTRAQMAKMIYTIRNGGNDNADAYKSATTTFTDISGHWAEGYIKYLWNTNIIAGKSETIFDPDATVTTAEAMKMALVLGGYRADKANLTGASWFNNTVSLATTNKLTDDVYSAMNGGCTRQDAAQILANALSMTAVQWSEFVQGFVNDSDSGLAISGDKITVGEKWMDLKTETGFITKAPNSKTNPKGITFIYDADDNGIVNSSDTGATGGEVTFKNAPENVSDLFGYEVQVVWNAEKAKNGDADAIYGIYKTDNNTEYTMTWDDVEQDGKNANKVKFNDKTYELKLDDEQSDFIEGKRGIASGSGSGKQDDSIAAYLDGTVKGVDASFFDNKALSNTVTFIDNDGDGKIEAVQVKEVDVAKITYVGPESITTTLVDKNTTGRTAPTYVTSPKLADVTVYEGIAKGDYAKVTYDYHNDKIVYEKIEKVTGKIEATRTSGNNTKEIRVDGNWYKASDDYSLPTTLYTGDTIEFVAIDNLLYYVEKTDGTYGSKSLAMIYNAANYDVGVDKDKIQVSIITRDGTKTNVFVDEDLGWNNGKIDSAVGDGVTSASTIASNFLTTAKNKLVTYRIVDGEYRFQEVGATNLAGFDAAANVADNGSSDDNYYHGTNKFDSKIVSDDAVVFVYDTTNGTEPKVMTGKQLHANVGIDSTHVYPNYLYNTDKGYTEVMACAIGFNQEIEVVGTTYAVLTSDAYETEVDKDGYRYFSMYVSGLGNVTAREKSNNNYTYDAGSVMKYELVSTDENGMITIKNVSEVAPSTGRVTSDGIVDNKYIGINDTQYEVTADTVYLDMNTAKNEGVAYGDEVKSKLTEADKNKANVRYVVTSEGKVAFILIDSTHNQIITGDVVESPSNDVLNGLLDEAESGEAVTVSGNVPAGNIVVPTDVGLKVGSGATFAEKTTIDNNTGNSTDKAVVFEGDLEIAAGADVTVEGDAVLNKMPTVEGTLKVEGTIDATNIQGITDDNINDLLKYSNKVVINGKEYTSASGSAYGATVMAAEAEVPTLEVASGQTLTIINTLTVGAGSTLKIVNNGTVTGTIVGADVTSDNFAALTVEGNDINAATESADDNIKAGTYKWYNKSWVAYAEQAFALRADTSAAGKDGVADFDYKTAYSTAGVTQTATGFQVNAETAKSFNGSYTDYTGTSDKTNANLSYHLAQLSGELPNADAPGGYDYALFVGVAFGRGDGAAANAAKVKVYQNGSLQNSGNGYDLAEVTVDGSGNDTFGNAFVKYIAFAKATGNGTTDPSMEDKTWDFTFVWEDSAGEVLQITSCSVSRTTV